MDYTYVDEGDVLEYGGRRLRVIMTPGHTPGHICLYDPDAKVMFLGDHVLFDITPNITTWPGFSDPLGTLCAQPHGHQHLRRAPAPARAPRRLTAPWPSASAPSSSTTARGYARCWAYSSKNPKLTAYELSGLMTWRVHGKSPSWADFPLQQKWFAVGETAAHLEYLLVRDRVRRELDNGVYRYYI